MEMKLEITSKEKKVHAGMSFMILD